MSKKQYAIGTSSPLKLEYNVQGESTWKQGCMIIHENGKKELIELKGGSLGWRGNKEKDD